MDDGAGPTYRGDEARLFAEFDHELKRTLQRIVHTSEQIIEDAAAFAWVQFITHQPDRDREWRGWLVRVAQREAWRLHRLAGDLNFEDERDTDFGRARIPDPVDPRNRLRERFDFEEAMQILDELPPRLRRIAFMRAAGFRYDEIMELTGDSRSRLYTLISRANDRTYAAIERQRSAEQAVPPRVRRLADLERAAPAWLVAEIGRPPRSRERRAGNAARLLAWRRAALAIDDYREASGFKQLDRGLGHRPDDANAARYYDHARKAIAALDVDRPVGRELR